MKLYQDKNWLYQKYILEEKSTRQIANECFCGCVTVLTWLKKFGIPRRNKSESLKGKKCLNWGGQNPEVTKEKIRLANSGEKSSMFGKKREEHPAWKGGRRKDSKGYILIYDPEHPFAHTSGYIFEHRLVMEKTLGRFLEPYEEIHHRNDNHADNRPENLRLFSSKNEHVSFHHKEKIQKGKAKGGIRGISRLCNFF